MRTTSTMIKDCRLFMALDGEVTRDGNMYGAVIGKDLQQGCASFKPTRMEAVLTCVELFKAEQVIKRPPSAISVGLPKED